MRIVHYLFYYAYPNSFLAFSTVSCGCRFPGQQEAVVRIQSVKRRPREMGRRGGLRARCRERCGTLWITCKCHHTAVDTYRTCAAGCRNSRRTLTICCTKTYLVVLNFMFLVSNDAAVSCSVHILLGPVQADTCRNNLVSKPLLFL